jgi:hypothetical protein
MEKICSEIQPLPRPLQANSAKSPPLPLVSHWRKFAQFGHSEADCRFKKSNTALFALFSLAENNMKGQIEKTFCFIFVSQKMFQNERQVRLPDFSRFNIPI